MRIFICLLLSVIFQGLAAQAGSTELDKFFKDKWNLTPSAKQELVEGEVLSDVDVTSNKKQQAFDLKAAGWHNKKCSVVLRKLSMLEKYKDWMGFVETSTYNEKARLFTLTADHTLLPNPMIIHIIMDRPTKQGVYPFFFPTGMFKGLKGQFTIAEKKNRCLIYASSKWKGPKTNYPDTVIKIFAETLSKKGAETLIRKTQF
ncbi:MAG: hypothetical protein CME64_13260 [Halobacteriovoraceae bacterium]|nr:hypothetical protein [Halobacteriovoraceae bacterium]|tara:strand:+ start:43731 stop:44336 length:606 start_codon:yes stop_codon:yes gene_type:complete